MQEIKSILFSVATNVRVMKSKQLMIVAELEESTDLEIGYVEHELVGW